jgi:phosphonate transport system substrate-binding protein
MQEQQKEATDAADGAGRGSRHARSNRWLVAAIAATAIGLVVFGVAVSGLFLSDASVASSVAPVVEADDPSALVVAVSRTPGGPGEWENFARTIKYLSDELQRPVAVRYLTEEELAADVIRDEQVDVAFVCAHIYLDLKAEGEVEALVTPVVGGTSETSAMIVVRGDSTFESWEDLEGTAVAVSDKSSLGGYAYLQWLAEQKGVELREYFSEVRIGDTQDQNLGDLSDGRVEATVVNSVQVVHRDMSAFRVVEESEPFGAPPLVATNRLDAETAAEVKEALIAFDAGSRLSEDSAIDGFVDAATVDYSFEEILRHVCGEH